MRAPTILLLVALAAPAAGRAAPPDPTGWSGLVLGARVGYGAPFGRLTAGGVEVRDVVDWKVPIWLEVGYRFGGHLRGELFFELAPGSVAEEYCTPEVSCSVTGARFGIALQLHLLPGKRFDPWVGVGVGIEVLNAQLSDAEPLAPAGRHDLTYTGYELPLVEVGIDVAVSQRFDIGPYVSASFGQFTSLAQRPRGGTRTSESIDARDTHGWLQAGLKMTLRL